MRIAYFFRRGHWLIKVKIGRRVYALDIGSIFGIEITISRREADGLRFVWYKQIGWDRETRRVSYTHRGQE